MDINISNLKLHFLTYLVNPDAFEYGNPQPFGGNLVSHASTYIISLKRRKRNSIEATLIKSPVRGYVWHPLSVSESGFYDIKL
jgi:hypothetical protein